MSLAPSNILLLQGRIPALHACLALLVPPRTPSPVNDNPQNALLRRSGDGRGQPRGRDGAREVGLCAVCAESGDGSAVLLRVAVRAGADFERGGVGGVQLLEEGAE